ncbi:unnamed protein product [Lasius platythorax]|uniref:Uncharacterized protein n=1 Tax=Lasius platythorax TaxID=488582 RepID=A0AAV2NEM6_9HYME
MYLPQRELAQQRRILKSRKETVRRADELLNEGSKLFESHGNIWKGKINAGPTLQQHFFSKAKLGSEIDLHSCNHK